MDISPSFKKFLRIVFILAILFFFMLPLFLSGGYLNQAETGKMQELERVWELFFWNSGQMRIILQAPKSQKELTAISNLAFDEVLRLDSVINENKPTSEAGIMRVQLENGKKSVVVSQEIFGMIEFARDVSKASHGAFDITVAPLINLWKKGGQSGRIPTEKEIQEVRETIGWHLLELDKEQRKVGCTSPKISIALGGFSKGYAVDCVVSIMKKQGISAGMVQMGGEVHVFGKREWKVGIQDPRIEAADGPKIIIGVIAVSNMAISTSGHYRRYVEIEGKRYSHIIDPRTGFPVPPKIVSVTVLASTSMEADAYATAFCILGVEEALRLAQEKNLETAIIAYDGSKYTLHTTPNFEKFWVQKPDFGTK